MRLLLLFLLLSAFSLPVDAAESRRLLVQHEDRTRQALIDAQPDVRNAPMLIVLHGGLAGPMTVRRRAGVTLASKGWVVAWPSAIDDWNDGRVDWKGNPYDTADDVGFLRKMVDELSALGMVDPGRVFVAGPSIGGVMALRMLCDAPDLIAGVAVAIASFPKGTDCKSGPSRPVIYVHGTDDSIMPPDGGRIGGWNPPGARQGLCQLGRRDPAIPRSAQCLRRLRRGRAAGSRQRRRIDRDAAHLSRMRRTGGPLRG